MKATLSLDLDNKWSYMKTHGDPQWETMPSYLDIVVPAALRVLRDLGLRITFFIVGQDAAIAANAETLRSIADDGHEIGNHSFHHEPWIHRRPQREIEAELALAEDSIERATAQRPKGYRSPGFANSSAVFGALARRGYQYDASRLPTFIGPIARAYYFRSTKLDEQQKAERADLFGSFTDGFLPNRRHLIDTPAGSLTEVPVTTFPAVRLPIHVSYVLYLATFSPALARAYFSAALFACRCAGSEPSILLHPLDFLTARDCPELDFFPAMTLDPNVKRRMLVFALEELIRNYDVLPIGNLISQSALVTAH